MEIKDLATKVELGVEMAEVRGGSRYWGYPSISLSAARRSTDVGNVAVTGLTSVVANDMTNGDVNANTYVTSKGASSGGFAGIGSVVTYAPTQSVTQTSGVAVDISSKLSGLNFA